MTLLVCVGLILGLSAPPAAMQPGGRTLDLPVQGSETEQSLMSGQSDEWRIDLTPGEFLQIGVDAIDMREADQWPLIAIVAANGDSIDERTEPNLVPSIDHGGRTVLSLVADRPGPYRLRVTARASTAPVPMRYRVRLDDRRPALPADERRIAAHRLWRDGGRLLLEGSRDALRASTEKFEEALKILADIGDEEGQALTLGTLAKLAYASSDAARGTAATTRALEIWKRLGRERDEAVATSDLGLLAYMAYGHDQARVYYDQALPKHRSTGDVLSEARTLTRMGWLAYAGAKLQDVLEVENEALLRFREVNDHTGQSIVFNDLGRAYLDLGDISQAIDSFEQALALRPPDRDPRGAANVLIRMGLVYLSVAEWQRALDALQQARALAQRAHDARSEITTLVNLGSAYVTFGDANEAFRYLEPALSLARSIDFKGAEGYALLWLGVGSSLKGEGDRSRDYLQQAIAVQTSIKDVRGQATSLRQLAAVQLELGLPQEALQSINRSVEVSPAASGLIYTGALTLANVYAALGDAAKAQQHYEAALNRLREVRARHAEGLALTRFARFQAQRGQHAEAREMLGQALAIHESLRGLIVDPDLRMSYTSTSLGPYQLFVDVLMEMERQSPGAGYAAAAFHTNERARARGLLDMLVTSGVDIRQGVDTALVDRERTLRWRLNAKAAVQTTLLAGKRDARRLAAVEKEIVDLSREWRETTTMIRQQSPAYASLTEPQPLTVDEVGALLDADTVLLEIAPGETQTWLFAVTNTGFESFALPSRETIDAAARDVHRLLTARQPVRDESSADRQARVARADAELAERTRALSDLVLGPIAARLRSDWRGRRLAIVPDGALEYVPFAALPVPGRAAGARATPLIAAHELVTLPSASSLALLRREGARRPSAQKTIAVFADPVFASDDPRVGRTARDARPVTTTAADAATRPAIAAADSRSLATRAFEPFVGDDTRGSLARLPFSRAEALAVASQVPASSLLQATDFDATLGLATSGRLNDYRIVHFATHGLVNTTRPELSGLALSLVDAEGRSRDGFLRLNTIYNLRLSADLVVLSACQSALGKEIAGEGLVGLTRGFMYAGAKRVIASLWQVSDVATAELMKKFYAHMLQHHLAPADALRRAQLEIARDPRWASPYFWAGFVLQGDWKQ
jgi:CHAT domain-containing protein/tetratricopeptide (TPR) repeat protein